MKFKIFTTLLLGLLFSFPAAATVHTVEMVDNAFVPATLDINVGDTVVWVNDGAAIHTATSGVDCTSDGIFDSGSVSPGGEYMFVFESEGQFPYYCIPHCTVGMEGQINVSGTSPVDEQWAGADVSLYPNPAQSHIDIQLDDPVSHSVDIEIFDLGGKRISTRIENSGNNIFRLDLQKFEQGIYTVRIYGEGRLLATGKFTRM